MNFSSSMFENEDDCIGLTTLLVLIGIVLSTLEWLWISGEFAPRGLYDWKVISIARDNSTLDRSLGFFFKSPAILTCLLSVRLFTAIAVLAIPSASPILWTLLLMTHLLVHFRTCYGLDGADQMLLIVTLALFVDAIIPDDGVRMLSLAFIAAQSCLSYFVSGIAKLFGKTWRTGAAVREIITTRSFGVHWAARLLERFPQASVGLTYFILVFECTFPVVVLLSPPYSLAYVVVGCVFHIVNAHVMGLNMFVWAFLATYPSILFWSSRIHQDFSIM
jgi:hypothetical protein